MRHFQLLSRGNNFSHILHGIMRRPELWNQNTLRTTHPGTPHREVDDIWLRFQDLSLFAKGGPQAIIDEHESINYPAMWELPGVRPVIMNLMTMVGGERLGRCLITRLGPGKSIDRHADGGSHAAYYDRYHVVLNGGDWNHFECADEAVAMHTGDIWWFNNALEHYIENQSAYEDRIHMIVDIRTPR